MPDSAFRGRSRGSVPKPPTLKHVGELEMRKLVRRAEKVAQAELAVARLADALQLSRERAEVEGERERLRQVQDAVQEMQGEQERAVREGQQTEEVIGWSRATTAQDHSLWYE
eukprot:Sspe_Gene.1530::Locus_502_Transcript_4_5_Confidence_0.250_Length_413::g.1530::m.1530